MSFWRLKVNRPLGDSESFDLRLRSSVSVGEHKKNDVCVATTSVPLRHTLVQKKSSNLLLLRLTSDIIPSLQGQFRERKYWKDRLYSGKEFEVEGPCQFKIGEVDFQIEDVSEVRLPYAPRQMDPEEAKTWYQSTGASIGIHAMLLLLLLLVSLLPIWKKPEDQVVQKLTIVDVQKILQKKPLPETPVEPVQPKPIEPEKKVEPTKKAEVTQKVQDNLPAEKTSDHARVAARTPLNPGKTAGKQAGNKPRNVDSLGLLAIQTRMHNSDPSGLSMKVAAPRAPRRADASNLETSLGSGTADYGLGSGKDTGQIATLEAIHGESYRGGVARQVTATQGPSIHLSRKEIEVRGGLDPAVIRQIIEERLSEVRYCYEAALLKHNNLAGKIATTWTIEPDGSVADISSASDEIGQNILQPCVREQILKWHFPSPHGGGVVHVKYPFVFSPIGG